MALRGVAYGVALRGVAYGVALRLVVFAVAPHLEATAADHPLLEATVVDHDPEATEVAQDHQLEVSKVDPEEVDPEAGLAPEVDLRVRLGVCGVSRQHLVVLRFSHQLVLRQRPRIMIVKTMEVIKSKLA